MMQSCRFKHSALERHRLQIMPNHLQVSKRAAAALEYLDHKFDPISPGDMEAALETMMRLYREDKIIAAGKLLEQVG